MLEEEKKPDETPEGEQMPDDDGGTDGDDHAESSSKEDETTTIDYKAQLEALERKLDREKSLREYERGKRKEAERGRTRAADDDSGDRTDENPLDVDAIVAKLQDTLNQRIDAERRQMVSDHIEEALDSYTRSDEERDYVKSIYENVIRPSGFSSRDIKNDIRRATLIANEQVYISRLEEEAEKKARKKLAEEEVNTKTSKDSGTRNSPETSIRMSSEERRMLEGLKLDPSITKKRLKK